MITTDESQAIAAAINSIEVAYISGVYHIPGSFVWHMAHIKILEQTKILIMLGVDMFLNGSIGEEGIDRLISEHERKAAVKGN